MRAAELPPGFPSKNSSVLVGIFCKCSTAKSTTPIFPSDALCQFGFHLSLLAGAFVQQRLFCWKSGELCFCWCYNARITNQTRFSCSEKGGNDFLIFFSHHSEKSKAHKGLYVSGRGRRQSPAQRAALTRPDRHWK